jgi:phosphoglycolate phosphatase-like HAD superfamily hydrolase
MRIGVDFDNTIVDYEGVFHAAALERGLIEASLPKDKNAVRDFLNGSGRKDDFTALQGYVYGSRMELARPYPGFREFVSAARAAGHDVFIVSHKTRFPLLGPKYDMHDAARAFLSDRELAGGEAVPHEQIYFEETKEQKIERASVLGVDAFIDDLPEILAMPGLTSRCRRILFAPNGAGETRFEVCGSWDEITALLLGAPR